MMYWGCIHYMLSHLLWDTVHHVLVQVSQYTVGKISQFSDMKKMLPQVGFEPGTYHLLHCNRKVPGSIPGKEQNIFLCRKNCRFFLLCSIPLPTKCIIITQLQLCIFQDGLNVQFCGWCSFSEGCLLGPRKLMERINPGKAHQRMDFWSGWVQIPWRSFENDPFL